MKHHFSTRVRTVLLLAVLLAVALGIIGNLTGMSLPDMLVKGVLTPIRAGVSGLTDQAERLYDYVFEYEKLLAENEALREKIAQIEDAAREADSIARENQNLRDLLELKKAREDFKLVDGYIISWSSNDWSNTLTINTGANAGIQPGMCAITATGEVVGLVSEVGPNYSVIKSVLDASLEISATIASSGYNGMVQGGYATGLSGLLRMNYLPSSAVIRNNDQVITTGSTVYPRNLILGYVVDAGFDDAGVAKYAILKPAADIGQLEHIFIVTDYNVG